MIPGDGDIVNEQNRSGVFQLIKSTVFLGRGPKLGQKLTNDKSRGIRNLRHFKNTVPHRAGSMSSNRSSKQ